MYWKTVYLINDFFRLRADSHAQYEIRAYARCYVRYS
jgi:Thymidylate synthase complementing protein.